MGNIPLDEGEVCLPDALDDMKPDEEHFHEATGNEGASFERTYARAALVLWLADRKLAVLNQAGRIRHHTVPRGPDRALAAGGENQSSALRQGGA